MSDCLTIFFDVLKSKRKGFCAQLDSLAQTMTRWDRQRFFSAGSDPNMPRLIWHDGITSITQMPAKHKVGLMLTIVILSQMEAGRELLVPALADEGESHHAATARYYKMVYVFQMMLSYWSWLKKESYWERGDNESLLEAKAAIRRMLVDLSALWPRLTGNKWAKPKFHEQLHVPDDIERNGAPINTNSGLAEHNHISNVKRPARNTQRRRAVFDRQIAERISETYIIDTAYQRMTFDYNAAFGIHDNSDPGMKHGIPPHASTFLYTIEFGPTGQVCRVTAAHDVVAQPLMSLDVAGALLETYHITQEMCAPRRQIRLKV